MNLLQILAARLRGFDYVLEVWKDSAYIRRVRRVGKYMVLDTSHKTRIFPGGRIATSGAAWEPLTSGAKKFYDLEVI